MKILYGITNEKQYLFPLIYCKKTKHFLHIKKLCSFYFQMLNMITSKEIDFNFKISKFICLDKEKNKE